MHEMIDGVLILARYILIMSWDLCRSEQSEVVGKRVGVAQCPAGVAVADGSEPAVESE